MFHGVLELAKRLVIFIVLPIIINRMRISGEVINKDMEMLRKY